MARRNKAEQAEYDAERIAALDWLRDNIRPGQTIYTILAHCSRSGMHRRVHVCTVIDGEIVRLNYRTALALDMRAGKDDALCVDGCGFDVGFQVVYNLGRVLFPNGGPDATNQRRGPTGEHDPDGGYQLRHHWLA